MRLWQLTLILAGLLLAGVGGEARRIGRRHQQLQMRKRSNLVPVFRSLNEFADSIVAQEEDEEQDNAPTTTATVDAIATSPEAVIAADKPKLMLVKTAASGSRETGRTLGHLFLLKGLTSGFGGNSNGCNTCNNGHGNGGPGQDFVIYVNNPTNVTNINNNTAISNRSATGGTSSRRNFFYTDDLAESLPTPVYQQRVSSQQRYNLADAAAATIPLANRFDFQGGNFMPFPDAQNVFQQPAPRRRWVQQQRRRYNPFRAFANNLKGIQYL